MVRRRRRLKANCKVRVNRSQEHGTLRATLQKMAGSRRRKNARWVTAGSASDLALGEVVTTGAALSQLTQRVIGRLTAAAADERRGRIKQIRCRWSAARG